MDIGRQKATGAIQAEGTMVRFFVFLISLLAGSATAAPLRNATGDFGAAVERTATPRSGVILIAATAAPEPGELFRDCPDCPEMVVVPSGEFDMGGKDTPFEGPPHRV